MSRTDIGGDLTCHRLTPRTFDCPADTLTDAAVASSAQIDASKLCHSHRKEYAQPNTAATTATIPLHVARFSGTVAELVGGSIAAAIGAATVTCDLKKNGTSILTTILTLDSANAARVVEVAVLNGSLVDYVAGDWFELVVTATAGGGTLPTGLMAAATFNENSQ